MCRMSQESPEKASQYIKEDIHKYKAVTLSKYVGNLLRDCQVTRNGKTQHLL
jgi:hypothetical protein